MIRRRRRVLRPDLDRLDDRCLPSGLIPAQLTHSYGLDAITFSANGQTIKGDGSGQAIAIIDAFHDPYLASDLRTFDQAYQLPDPALTQINLAGSRTDDGWAQEEALDVEWAHAIAPGARIVVVEVLSTSRQDLLAAVDIARIQPGVSVVSMSWGGGEFSRQTGMDGHFTTPAGHNGVAFVAASGDSGSRGGAEWPASSPNVLAVGGTSLAIGSGGSYVSESIWIGSGGGTSRYVTEPSYQRGVQSSGRRMTPDVAFDADPSTGVAVYTTAPSTGNGSWPVFGGTSLGAPAWAAIIAIANQGRAVAGVGSLDGRSQTLPLLYSLPSSDFHKIGGPFAGTQSRASAGLGTPNGVPLVNDLATGATPTSAVPMSRLFKNKKVAKALATSPKHVPVIPRSSHVHAAALQGRASLA